PLFATPFDRTRPPWEAYLIEGLDEGKSALFVKLHHCLTDGVGGARLTGALLHADEGVEPYAVVPPTPARGPLRALARACAYRVAEAASLAQDAAVAAGSAMLHPLRTATSLASAVQTGAGFAAEMVANRAKSPLHRARSSSRRLAATTIPL